MAVTFIYPIKSTPKAAMRYSQNDKVIDLSAVLLNISPDKDDVADSIAYSQRQKNADVTAELLEKVLSGEIKGAYYDEMEEKIYFKTYKSSLNCSVENAAKEFEVVRKFYNKDSGNKAYCLIQNFGEGVDPELANQIGLEFAQEYLADYQCVISTHTNTGKIHNHIDFNAVSFVNGKKYNDCLKALQDIRRVSDKLCRKYNLEVIIENEEITFVKYKDKNGKTRFYEPTERKRNLDKPVKTANDFTEKREVKFFETKLTHAEEIRRDIDMLLPMVKNYEELIKEMRLLGYEVNAKRKDGSWKKHISFKGKEHGKATRDTEDGLGFSYTRVELERRIKEKDFKVDHDSIQDKLESLKPDEKKDSKIYQNLYKETKTILQEAKPGVRLVSSENRTRRDMWHHNMVVKNLNTLKVVRNEKIGSVSEVKDLLNKTEQKKMEVGEKLKAAKNMLKELSTLKNLIIKYQENPEQLTLEEKEQLASHNLLDAGEQNQFLEKVLVYEKEIELTEIEYESINIKFQEYKNAYSTLSYVTEKYKTVAELEKEKQREEEEQKKEEQEEREEENER